MLRDKNLQYINIKHFNKQLKIDTQILKDGQIIKTETASFLVDEDLSSDAIAKLNILQKNISHTYLTTLCESVNQKIVDDDFIDDNYKIKKLTAHLNVALPIEDIAKYEKYFLDTGIDYIFSPFNILYNHILTYGANTNSLNMLILNNTIYALILNDQQKIVHSAIKTLTAFDDIQSSEFYEDPLEKQKLFDEMHLLEVQDAITAITTEFYETANNETFCESVSIFYTIKQLNDEQLKQIEDALMLEIEYSNISIDDYLFSLSKNLHVSTYSFIHARKKQNKQSFLLWIISAVLSTVLVGSVLYYMQIQEKQKQEQLKQEKIKKQQALIKAKKLSIKLPNHKKKNKKIANLIFNLFDLIPNKTVLREFQLQDQDLTMVCSFLEEDTFEKTLKPQLSKYYHKTELLLIQRSKPIYNAIISASDLIRKKSLKKQIQPKYKKDMFLSQEQIISNIKTFLPKDTKVIYNSTKKRKYLTYNFTVTTTFQEPKEFFDFIKQLNQSNYSINIAYPIEFAKTKKGIETTFDVQFHQLKPIKSK